jgi:hypothetical protein
MFLVNFIFVLPWHLVVLLYRSMFDQSSRFSKVFLVLLMLLVNGTSDSVGAWLNMVGIFQPWTELYGSSSSTASWLVSLWDMWMISYSQAVKRLGKASTSWVSSLVSVLSMSMTLFGVANISIDMRMVLFDLAWWSTTRISKQFLSLGNVERSLPVH